MGDRTALAVVDGQLGYARCLCTGQEKKMCVCVKDLLYIFFIATHINIYIIFIYKNYNIIYIHIYKGLEQFQ